MGGQPPVMRPEPAAAAILQRSLLIWGLGHLSLGDRRGWLLIPAQVVALVAFIALSGAFIQGSRWITLFPVLLLLVVAWVGQAIHAHQRAVQMGRAPGGELQIAWLLPLIVAAVTAFWLVGGQHASPTATLQQYVAAWRSDRPGGAARLFHQPLDAAGMEQAWQAHEQYLSARMAEAAASFGSSSGLDPLRPFSGLRFIELAAERTPDSATFAIEITRRQRVETTLFGLLPTASQQTVVVERVGLIGVRAYDSAPPSWLPPDQLPSRLWLIERVELPAGQPVSVGQHPF